MSDYGTIPKVIDGVTYHYSYKPIDVWNWIINDHSLSFYKLKLELFVQDNVLVWKDCGEHHSYGGCYNTHFHIGEWGTELVRWLFNA